MPLYPVARFNLIISALSVLRCHEKYHHMYQKLRAHCFLQSPVPSALAAILIVLS